MNELAVLVACQHIQTTILVNCPYSDEYNIFPYVRATYDSAIEKLGAIQVVGGVASEEVIALSQAELDEATLTTKRRQFKQSFELLARCSIAVFEKLKADGVIAGTDFPVDIRQDYVDLKNLVDELFPQ